MAGMTMLKGNKYKYMPLSEANVKPAMVSAFDGQNIYVAAASASAFLAGGPPSGPASLAAEPKREVRYSMGNYLGGGIAGVVNEAYDKLLQRHVAIKMLNPVGYKLSTPSVLRRAEIIKKGVPIVGNLRGMTPENVFWVKLPTKRDLIACYADFRHAPGSALSTPITTQMLRELTLEMCVALWQLDADEDAGDGRGALNATYSQPQHCREEMKGSGGVDRSSSTSPGCGIALHGSGGVDGASEDDELMMMMMMNPHGDVDGMDGDAENELMLPPREEEIKVGEVVYKIPTIPAKYKAFLDSRKSIYREIAHMHKLTGNSVSGQLAHGGHPNVLKLYDVLEYIQPSKSTIFLVLELASGGELFDRIRSDNGVDENVARGYFTQLLSGVLFCHQLGIVHRDLKPENLLLSDSDVLKIADFGLSAHFIAAVSSGGNGAGDALPELDDDDMDTVSTSSSVMIPAARFRRLNSIVGSPHYVAPEVLQNARYGYDGRKADMWSIGVILYGLLAGSLPFGKELQTCPRYLKFCEWIRSLPCDPQTGKLIYDASIYQPSNAPVRIPTTTPSTTIINEPTTTHGIMNPTEDDTPVTLRLAQVHPNLQPLSSSGWLQNGKPPIKPSEISAGTATVAPPAPGGRRGSRVVSFPTWLFPSKLSPQAVFLMASLLHPEPGKRLACEDACRAAWVAGISV